MGKQKNKENRTEGILKQPASGADRTGALVQSAIKVALVIVLVLTAALFCYAILTGPVQGEAYYGKFATFTLNEGWTMRNVDTAAETTVTLPISFQEKTGTHVVFSRRLPDNIEDGMSLLTRSSMQDMVIRIGGQVRASYTTAGFAHMNDKLPGTFLVVDLTDEDALQTIELDITSKKNSVGKYNGVTCGFGDNVWFPIVRQNLAIFLMSILVILVGAGAFLAYLLLRSKNVASKSLLYLSGMMMVDGMWILSESELRQLVFRSPSYASVFAFVLVSSIAPLTVLYFNEVQNHRYQKWHTAICGIAVCQVILNSVLNFTGLVQYYDTLKFAHLWTAVACVIAVTTLILDVRSGQIKNYGIVAIGCVGLLICAMVEMFAFYLSSTYKLGAFLGIGLVILLVATLSQTFVDAVASVEKRRQQAENRNKMTIHTITRTIDAKDEYTGGHSERVGEYARILCEAVADQYGFTKEDFERIQYIGNLHDIGKIGVPDSVLNKKGKLDSEEFALMKQHTTIGSRILENMDTVEGLSEGVRYHHERYDGKGYPDGLKGEEIPICARILCLADCYDAMTSDRVYRKRLPDDAVRAEIARCTGTQFDPNLAAKFLELIDNGTIYPFEATGALPELNKVAAYV